MLSGLSVVILLLRQHQRKKNRRHQRRAVEVEPSLKEKGVANTDTLKENYKF